MSVDPYFTPQDQRFKRPLQAFLQIVTQRPSGIPVARIEIHTGYDDSAGTKIFLMLKVGGICLRLSPEA
jgi:hypothetical protein